MLESEEHEDVHNFYSKELTTYVLNISVWCIMFPQLLTSIFCFGQKNEVNNYLQANLYHYYFDAKQFY